MPNVILNEWSDEGHKRVVNFLNFIIGSGLVIRQ